MPALLTRTVGKPRVLRISVAEVAMEANEVTSQWKNRTLEFAVWQYQNGVTVIQVMGKELTSLIGQWLDVQDSNLDIPTCKQANKMLSNPLTASSHDNNLLCPIVSVAFPIVKGTSRKNAV